MSTSPVASVVVTTFNRSQVLERCLRALLDSAAGTPSFEIIVVDDASTDDTEARVRALGASEGHLTYVRQQSNRGLSAARNAGIRRATGRIVILLDDDIVADPGYIGAHLASHARYADEHIAVVGNLSFPAEVVRRSNYARYLQSRYLGNRDDHSHDGIDLLDLHPRFLGGGITSIRLEDLNIIGLFDEAVRSYGCEDHIFARRLKDAGVRLVFASDARATHLDVVTLAWYRAKMLETARDGIPLLLDRYPDFLEETALGSLLPVDWGRERGTRAIRKLVMRAVLNPVTVWLLDRWARTTDHIGPFYSSVVYRALTAGWLLQGQRLKRGGPRIVRYGT